MTRPTKRDIERQLDDLDGGEGEPEEIHVRVLRGEYGEDETLEEMTHYETTFTR